MNLRTNINKITRLEKLPSSKYFVLEQDEVFEGINYSGSDTTMRIFLTAEDIILLESNLACFIRTEEFIND